MDQIFDEFLKEVKPIYDKIMFGKYAKSYHTYCSDTNNDYGSLYSITNFDNFTDLLENPLLSFRRVSNKDFENSISKEEETLVYMSYILYEKYCEEKKLNPFDFSSYSTFVKADGEDFLEAFSDYRGGKYGIK